MYNPKNVFGMEEVKVQKNKGVQSYGAKPSMKGVKTSGIILGSFLESILKRFDEDNGNPPKNGQGGQGVARYLLLSPLCTPPSIRNINLYTTVHL